MSKSSNNCIFCKIARKEMQASIEYEDESVVAFNDIKPEAPIHILIVPKEHLNSTNELTDKTALLMGKMVLAAKEITKKKGISETGYRLVMNCGKDGGQAVEHIHMHLLGGRQLAWPPG